MKETNIIIIFFISISSLSFIKSSNLRKNDEIIIQDINYLLTGLPTSYSALQKEMKSQKKCSFYKKLTLSYFKTLESNSNIKYYLNKELKDFDSIIKDIIKTMGISNPQNAYVIDIFDYKLTERKDFFENNKWVNFNIMTTIRNEEDTISFGSLFVSLNEGKFNFIFCYGYGDFKVNFSGNDAVLLGMEGDYKYIATAKSCTYWSKDMNEKDASYIVDFMNLVGFKVFGNKFGLDLPYPEID